MPILHAANYFRLCLFALFSCLCLAAGAHAKPAKPGGNEVSSKQADLQELRARIDGLRKEVASSEAQRASIADRLKDSERQISSLQRDLHQLSGRRGELQSEARELEQQAQGLRTRLLGQQQLLEQQIYRQYVRGNPDRLQLLLNGGDPNQLSRDIHYLSLIAQSRSSLLKDIEQTLEKKKALAQETRKHVEEVAAVEARQKERQSALVQQRNQRQTVLTEISGKISSQRKEIGNLQADEKRLSQLIDKLGKLLAARAAKAREAREAALRRQAEEKPVSPAPGDARPSRPSRPATPEIENQHLPEAVSGAFARLKGSLRLPARGSVAGRFGTAREGGGTWKGLFLKAVAGSEVRAIAPGRIVFSEWMRGFGNLLIIDHGDAYLSIYGNNEALLKQVGDSVKGGDAVASVGNSGGNPESGLYFEIRHQGQPQDPLKWVSLK